MHSPVTAASARFERIVVNPTSRARDYRLSYLREKETAERLLGRSGEDMTFKSSAANGRLRYR